MQSEVLWNALTRELAAGPWEFHTKRELWFKASLYHNAIIIDSAETHAPSCKIPYPRRIMKDEFVLIYPYFSGWLTGKKGITTEAQKLSWNTSYIFAMIKGLQQ